MEAKKLAAEERRSLGKVMDDALRLFLAHHRSRAKSARVDLPVCNAGKPLPGVDLNDTSRLLEIE